MLPRGTTTAHPGLLLRRPKTTLIRLEQGLLNLQNTPNTRGEMVKRNLPQVAHFIKGGAKIQVLIVSSAFSPPRMTVSKVFPRRLLQAD